MTTGSNLGEASQLLLPLPEDPDAPLHAYSEADAEEVATRFFETPRPEPTWLVQITLFDRRLMTKDGLLDELRRGRLVHGYTPVWRVGMPDWRALAYVDELRAAVCSLPAVRRRAPPPPSTLGPSGGWRHGSTTISSPAISAAALAFLALTLSALLALLR